MYFAHNTYNTESLLQAYEHATPINKNDELTLELPTGHTFDIYGSQTKNDDDLREIISAIPKFDRTVQHFCKLAYEQGKFDAKNYAVSLAWIEIQEDKVKIGYYGSYVNIELRAIFVKKGTTWKKEDIYYQ